MLLVRLLLVPGNRYSLYAAFLTFQLIIDECGSCTEPEGLVPIVSSEAKQVVLIGDHQQLQPVILDSMARKRGLELSLFERYSEKAIVLTTQYRMVLEIHFYQCFHFKLFSYIFQNIS